MDQDLSRSINLNQHGRLRYGIAMRLPSSLPTEKVQIPRPANPPQSPPELNMLMMILPPAIIILGTLIVTLFTQANWTMIAPMLIMSLGFPLANLISQSSAKKKHTQLSQKRQAAYIESLKQTSQHIDELGRVQRKILENEYPALNELGEIGRAQGANPRLWWRRRYDNDFLSLRVGTGMGSPSFSIELPGIFDQVDPLLKIAQELVEYYHTLADLPLLIDLKTVGSLALTGNAESTTYPLANRLLLDVLVHHSPEDVEVIVLSEAKQAARRWEWLKWAPHTRAFLGDDMKPHNLAFSEDQAKTTLIGLVQEFNRRKKQPGQPADASDKRAIVVVMDDAGFVRQIPDVSLLSAQGYTVGIYLLFMGTRGTPNSCRARLQVDDGRAFELIETWDAGKNIPMHGKAQLASCEESEAVSRALAGLEVSGGQDSQTLPESVRVSQILDGSLLDQEALRANWSKKVPDSQQMRFPVGVRVGHDGLEVFEIDFRPESKGGKGEYHAMLIGTTGSGKSIFLQSLVLAAAHRYSPRLLNFLFMDFKAGAAELKKISELPHVVGMITDLGPELAERALQALENELDRRKKAFDAAGKVTDIWDYNARFTERSFPHLLTVIDEFAEGIKILPNLVERLRELGRQGRAFGMYFLLANQEVNNAVEQLKTNVGWYIVLKVKRNEEMSLIDRSLPITPGRGRGYIRVKSDITLFQGAYAGETVNAQTGQQDEEFIIQKVEVDGRLREAFKKTASQDDSPSTFQTAIKELDLLMEQAQQTAAEMKLPEPTPIYRDPIPSNISLADAAEKDAVYRRFSGKQWSEVIDPHKKLVASIGRLDYPSECIQRDMEIDFNQADGNLWVVGTPGSGKARTVTALLLSLAQTHRPDEVQFYILEYGTGTLKFLEGLPHTAALIRLTEVERLERLLRFLEQESERRSNGDASQAENPDPEIFVIINNFAELRSSFPDQAEAISRYVRTGKGVGIHLVFSTNRGTELSRAIASNISQRIVLQMASNDEYLDVVGKRVFPLSAKAEGRGYWVDDPLAECQVASVGQPAKLVASLGKAWQGERPPPVNVLPSHIPYPQVLPLLEKFQQEGKALAAPIGFSYDTLELIKVDLAQEVPYWLVLGPRQSGKSQFLLSFAYGLWTIHQESLDLRIISLRRSPLARLNQLGLPIPLLSNTEEIVAELQKLVSRPAEGNPKKYVLLVDDLGAVFEMGREAVAAQLAALAPRLSGMNDTYILAAGLRDELQTQLNSPFLRVLRQSRTGMVFSKDNMDMDWLGVQLNVAQRKMNMPPGRGFFVSKGRVTLAQIPILEEKGA
ncbi:MAG: FtsK/SpoIIIE domain-containing protein [Chloroflexota bacterium]